MSTEISTFKDVSKQNILYMLDIEISTYILSPLQNL
jgi:hypothetical protein